MKLLKILKEWLTKKTEKHARDECLFDKKLLIHNLESIEKMLNSGTLQFEHRVISRDDSYVLIEIWGDIFAVSKVIFINKLPMKTKRVSFSSANKSWWEISVEDYNKTFLGAPGSIFLSCLLHIRECAQLDGRIVEYKLSQYEDTVLTIKNTFEESISINGKVGDIFIEEGTELLNMLVEDIEEAKRLEKELKDLEKEALNKSLSERLKAEKSWVKRFIKLE